MKNDFFISLTRSQLRKEAARRGIVSGEHDRSKDENTFYGDAGSGSREKGQAPHFKGGAE